MIDYKEKAETKATQIKSNSAKKNLIPGEVHYVNGIKMIYNPDLDKYSDDENLPEKYKEDARRLANSVLPKSSRPLK